MYVFLNELHDSQSIFINVLTKLPSPTAPLRLFLFFPAGEVIISLIQMYEANYPEILKTCYIINGTILN
jgi:hypothetical protein